MCIVKLVLILTYMCKAVLLDTETTVMIIKMRKGHKEGVQREYLIGTKS